MAISVLNLGVFSAASGASPQTRTISEPLPTGSVLVVAMVYDNSGTSGADPLTAFNVTIAGHTLTLLSAQTGLNDPGAVSAGLAVRVNAYKITGSHIPAASTVSISWTGTVTVRVGFVVRIQSSGGTLAYRTNSGATGTNAVSTLTPAGFVTPSVNTGEIVFCWLGNEDGAAPSADSDTVNGTWSGVSGTSTGTGVAGLSAYYQWKVVTATATQTWNPIGGIGAVASDWIQGCLIFTETMYDPLTFGHCLNQANMRAAVI